MKELTRVEDEENSKIDLARVERLVKGVFFHEVVRLLEIGRVGRCQVK